MTLHRYWIKFDPSSENRYVNRVKLGCGVTAFDFDDAIQILEEIIFLDDKTPAILSVVEDVDVSSLECNHVRINMDNPAAGGIWFPLGYDY